jgi:hypothetical protein
LNALPTAAHSSGPPKRSFSNAADAAPEAPVPEEPVVVTPPADPVLPDQVEDSGPVDSIGLRDPRLRRRGHGLT